MAPTGTSIASLLLDPPKTHRINSHLPELLLSLFIFLPFFHLCKPQSLPFRLNPLPLCFRLYLSYSSFFTQTEQFKSFSLILSCFSLKATVAASDRSSILARRHASSCSRFIFSNCRASRSASFLSVWSCAQMASEIPGSR
jgi:hypothetical protein